MEPARPTLDQIAVFLAIVEAGSFTAAARKLNRATSVISYAVTNLEAQLGVSLFERAGARRPRLTEAGRAILSDSRGIALVLIAGGQPAGQRSGHRVGEDQHIGREETQGAEQMQRLVDAAVMVVAVVVPALGFERL